MRNLELIIVLLGFSIGTLIMAIRRYKINRPWLFKKQVNHERLGKVWFNKSKNPITNHFQAHTFFNPTKKEIDIFFASEDAYLDPNQIKIYYEIENKYDNLLSQYFESIKSAKLDCDYDNVLFAIEIPAINSKDMIFKLHFIKNKDFYNESILTYKNWELINID
jgi:hypothetical protein